jgi:NTE family protein
MQDGLALVLGGGGVTGVGWETGLLKGLRDVWVDLAAAELIVGTSAGSIVGTQLAAGLELDELYARQLEPPDARLERLPPIDFASEMERIGPQLAKLWTGAAQSEREFGLPQAIRAEFGRFAVQADSVPEAERLEMIAHRLRVTEWPQRPLKVTAVDVSDGRFTTWDRDSGVDVVSAVASSCAVPLIWPPVTIADRRYMDGGVRSPTNADLAAGYARVVIVAPMGGNTELGASLRREEAFLRQQGAWVRTIEADAESLAAFGPNVLDPARRGASAEAGLRQATALGPGVLD